jgi:anaerobic ribonucleoside-triphosphate reductase activating protein
MSLYLYHIEKNTKVLGYGNRFTIWFQGCNKRCKNCLVPDSWDREKGGFYIEVDEVISQLSKLDIDGVTISGGEPFLQNSALLELVKKIKQLKLNIVVYSGYSYDELKENSINKEIFENIDILIDGEYIEELNYDTPFVGSTNQNVIILSDEGYQLAQFMAQQQNREVEFVIKNGELFIIGVPPKNLEKKLKGLL